MFKCIKCVLPFILDMKSEWLSEKTLLINKAHSYEEDASFLSPTNVVFFSSSGIFKKSLSVGLKWAKTEWSLLTLYCSQLMVCKRET